VTSTIFCIRSNKRPPTQDNRWTAQDVVFGQNARDNFNPLHYFGPNALDRTHMFTFAATFQVVGGLQLSLTTRINSALPATLTIPSCACAADINRALVCRAACRCDQTE
jgi:hypothetical protein